MKEKRNKAGKRPADHSAETIFVREPVALVKTALMDVTATTDAPARPESAEPETIHSNPTWPLEEAQSALTGWVGAFTVLFCALLTAIFREPPAVLVHLAQKFSWLWGWLASDLTAQAAVDTVWSFRFVGVVLSVFATMAFVELARVKVYRRHFDFTAPRAVGTDGWSRIGQRALALLSCFFVALFLYSYLSEYSFHVFPYPESFFYRPFYAFFFVIAPLILTGCIPYFWMVERYGRQPLEDEFLALARWLKRLPFHVRSRTLEESRDNAHVANLSRGMLVKFFFIPLMVKWTMLNWAGWVVKAHTLIDAWAGMHWNEPAQSAANIREFCGSAFHIIILVDLTVAIVGYVVSMRLFDTQVTSAEPTLLGWMVALFCYPPFVTGVTSVYLRWNGEDIWPADAFMHYPALALFMAALSLLLMGLYAWATFSFGMRFSNLTNRGVISCGPYRYVRHPAYICKNLSWWIQGLPFIFANMFTNIHGVILQVAHLAATTLIYGLRAWTEEKHMRREPHYKEYCETVKWRFIPRIF